MARGDPTFAKVDVAILQSSKFTSLGNDDRFVYLGLWLLAVESRTDVLRRCTTALSWLSHRSHCRELFLKRSLSRIAAAGLIGIDGSGDITVYRVKECHPKLRWDKSPGNAPYGAQTGPKMSPTEGESQRD